MLKPSEVEGDQFGDIVGGCADSSGSMLEVGLYFKCNGKSFHGVKKKEEGFFLCLIYHSDCYVQNSEGVESGRFVIPPWWARRDVLSTSGIW